LIHLVAVEELKFYQLAKEIEERPVLCSDTIDTLNSDEYRLIEYLV